MSSFDISVGPKCPISGPDISLAQGCPGSQYLIFMTILDMLIQSQEKVSQTCERVKPKIPPEYQYDFIVIGGE